MEQPARADDASLVWAGFALGLAALASLSAAVLLWRRARATQRPLPLIEHGERARATVLKLWDTGATQHQQPVIGFVFEVRRPRQTAYQIEARCAVPRMFIPQVQPGATVPVRVDAGNPARVSLDFGDA